MRCVERSCCQYNMRTANPGKVEKVSWIKHFRTVSKLFESLRPHSGRNTACYDSIR